VLLEENYRPNFIRPISPDQRLGSGGDLAALALGAAGAALGGVESNGRTDFLGVIQTLGALIQGALLMFTLTLNAQILYHNRF